MGFINVFLSTPCNLSIKNRQLVIQGDSIVTYPLEDIDSVLIESNKSVITSYALEQFAEHGIVAYICNKSHIPNGVILPFNSHSRQPKVLELQLSMSKALKKQLWQKIVATKIANQADSILLCTGEIRDDLLRISKNVLSDDSTNQEAVGAQKYFPTLFGKSFSRKNEIFINDCLDYGYAILRGVVARTLVVFGFNTNLGLHHKNQFNSFNLADDIMEPYRPIVDMVVYGIKDCNNELNPDVKRRLFSIVNSDVKMQGSVQPLSYAVELTVESLSKSLNDGKAELLLPELLNIHQHCYE